MVTCQDSGSSGLFMNRQLAVATAIVLILFPLPCLKVGNIEENRAVPLSPMRSANEWLITLTWAPVSGNAVRQTPLIYPSRPSVVFLKCLRYASKSC